MYKKFLSSILTVVMALSITSCGPSEEKSDSIKKVTWWNADGHCKDVYQEVVREFNENEGKELGIEIDYVYKQDIGNEIQVALQTNQAPDLFNGAALQNCVENGQLIAYEDIAGGAEYVKQFEKFLVEGNHTVKGKTYSAPRAVTLCGLVYNKDLFKEAGIVDENGEALPPETWDDVREACKKICALGDDKYGIIFPMKWGPWFEYDISYVNIANTGYCYYDYNNERYDATGFAPYLKAVKAIIDDGTCYPAPEMMDNDPARARFSEGNIGMKIAYSFDVGVFNDQFPAKCDWDVAPVPVVNKDEKYYQFMAVTGAPYMSAGMKDKLTDEQILGLMKWINGDEMNQMLYEKGKQIPWKLELIEKADKSNLPKGWESFAKLIEISAIRPSEARTEVSGKKTLQEMFYNDVLNGDASIDDICAEWTKTLNEGMAKYDELHPEDSSENYKTHIDTLRK